MTDLLTHGTRAFDLPPGAVISAAEIDLKHRQESKTEGRPLYRYNFHRKHVRKARDAADLIARAYDDLDLGAKSSKRATRLIYERRTLKAALDRVRGGQAECPEPPSPSSVASE